MLEAGPRLAGLGRAHAALCQRQSVSLLSIHCGCSDPTQVVAPGVPPAFYVFTLKQVGKGKEGKEAGQGRWREGEGGAGEPSAGRTSAGG